LKIAIDNGHGLNTAGKRTPPFPNSGEVIKEWEFNHPTALKLADILRADGHEVLLVSDTAEDTPLVTRASRANTWKADFFISIHYNAYNGVWGTHGGTETLYYENSTNGKKAAEYIQSALIQELHWRDRDLKPRKNLAVLNRTLMPAVLVEVGFMDNLKEASLMKDSQYQLKAARAIASGINKFFGYKPQRGKPILGQPTATILQMQEWARNKKATYDFIRLAGVFYVTAKKIGVNPIIAYAQSAKETGYGHFGGVIDASYHNTCGLKTTQGGDNYDANAHKRFSSWREGVRAHLDHLALYAGQDGYPDLNSPDPRHFNSIKGTAFYVEDLGGKWAPSSTYGVDIVKLANEIERTRVPRPMNIFRGIFQI